MPRHPRIGIDCRLGGLQHAGIGRYIAELVSRLIQDAEITWVLFVSSEEQALELVPKPPLNVEIIHAPVRHYSLQEQIRLPGIFTRAKLDLLHVPHFNVPVLYGDNYVVTVHDLLWHSHRGTAVTTLPKAVYWLKYLGYRMVAHRAITRAAQIMVPSKAVADTLVSYYPKATEKIVITPEGIGTKLAAFASEKIAKKRNEKTLLYVGSLYPHKNVQVVLQALKHLPDYRLQIISARSVFHDQVRREVHALQIEDRVQFVGEVSDQELAHAYESAGALIQPSKSEGFGLTGIEAMAFATPVIASDIPIFHEIYADAALYFDPDSPSSLVETLGQLTQKRRDDLAHQARAITRKYNWDNTTSLTKKTYYAALRTHHG